MAEVRDYELSLWTLQDSFLTVLKPYGIGVKNQVQEGKLNIKDDGNETLSFSIPMYLYSKTGDITTRKENPIWCNVINGTLIADLRKVKLIFDKHGAHEKVFEFIILKVTERHESDQLFCDVECEGLAFHELGKIGYKIVLSSDEFELDHKNWEESDQSEAEPVATIQYWNDKIFSDRKDWTYEVVMDQHEEVGRANLAIDKIYEDRYVASWEVVNDQLQPTRWEIGKEKARTTFEIKESNIFNATQEIAEAFGVFCRYEYEYDDNYHITGRKVVYYNNFLNEEIGAIDLTYPYNTNNITREMDSTDLVTKMYIQSVDDDLTDEGTVSITSVEANKMKEDYLLNFDYLYKIGSISNEQYEAISEFEVEIRKLNDQFEKYSSIYNNRGNQLINLEAEIQHLKDSITEDREEIVNVNDIIRAFGLSDGDNDAKTVKIAPPNGNAMRDTFISKVNPKKMAVSLPAEYSKGIAKKSDIKIYATYSSTTNKLDNPITSFSIDRNPKTQEIREIYNIPKKMKINGVNTEITKVYLSYKCNPSLQYAEVKQKYETKLAKDISRLNALEKRKVKVKSIYDNAESKINEITEKKKELILRFEEMMGPALREGYWNPESYNEYGNKYSGTISLMRETNNMHSTKDLGMRAQNFPLTDTGTYLDFVWDNGKDSDGEEIDTWMDEQKSYYESGVDQEKIYYPCMRITGPVLEELNKVFNPAPNPSDTDYEYWKKYEHKNFDDLEMYSLMFYIGTETQNQQILEDVDGWVSLAIGSECHFAFRKGYLKGDTSKPYIFPVFVLTGLDSFSDDTINMILTKTCKLARVVTWTKPDEEDEGAPSEDPEQTMLDMDEIVINNNLEMYWWVDSKVSDENTWYNGSTKLLTKTSGGFTPVKDYYPIQPYDLYYPRILIKTWKLKKSQDGELADLTIKCGNVIDGLETSGKNLKDFEDFSIMAITSEMQSDEDYVPDLLEAITIKPASLLKYGCGTREQGDKSIFAPYPVFSIDYSISNADTAIYLDSIQVIKENSQPKVSYTIDLNNTRKELIENAYNLLGTIAHINDTDLKFRNIQGYVSEVDMDLDHPWEDSITIQNYKNKFEDLFSKIVAETAAMQKNSYTVGFAANALTASGGITQDVMQYTILNTDLNYAFNNGKLTIDEVNGIMGESEAGVVAYRGGGIFTANEKDENGDWVWNTGILPTGINANLITAGRIDTNQVNIYAGSDLRFMWNGEGLFAYKWNTLEAELAAANGTVIPEDFVPKIDDKQYVRYNGEGLQLIAESGAQYLAPLFPMTTLLCYLDNSYKEEDLINTENNFIYSNSAESYTIGIYRDPTPEEQEEFIDSVETLHKILVINTEGYVNMIVPMPHKLIELDWTSESIDYYQIEAFGFIYTLYAQEEGEHTLRLQIYSTKKILKEYIGESNLIRASINWDDFCFRNWDNKKVFYVNEQGEVQLDVHCFEIGTKKGNGTYISNDTLRYVVGVKKLEYPGEYWTDSYLSLQKSSLEIGNYNMFSFNSQYNNQILYGFHLGTPTLQHIPDSWDTELTYDEPFGGIGFWCLTRLNDTNTTPANFYGDYWDNKKGVFLSWNDYFYNGEYLYPRTTQKLLLLADRVAIGSGALSAGANGIELNTSGSIDIETTGSSITLRRDNTYAKFASSYAQIHGNSYVKIEANVSAPSGGDAGEMYLYSKNNMYLNSTNGAIDIRNTSSPAYSTLGANNIYIRSRGSIVLSAATRIYFNTTDTGEKLIQLLISSSSNPSTSSYGIILLPQSGGNVRYLPYSGGNG